jgi:hypothetical protein
LIPCETPLGDERPHLLGGIDGGLALLAQLRREGGDGQQGVPLLVGDHLSVDVPPAAKHRQARAEIGAAYATPHAGLPPETGNL